MGRRGFTVVELLVTGCVLLLLACALLPLVPLSRERAQSAACKNNLRQMAQACLRYAQNEGHFPWGMIDPTQHDANYRVNAARPRYPRERPSLHGADSWSAFATFCWDFTRKQGGGWQAGEMFGGDNPDGVFLCPKCKGAKSDNWDGNRMTGYNYNVCYLGYVEGDSSARDYPSRLADIENPSRVVAFGDGGYAGGPNKFMRAPMQDKFFDNSNASLRKAGTQAFRHGSGRNRHCNMAFLDGHVEEFTRPYRAGGAAGWVDEATHTAFIAPDNVIYGQSESSK